MLVMGFPMHRLVTNHLTDKDFFGSFVVFAMYPLAVFHLPPQELHHLAGNAGNLEQC